MTLKSFIAATLFACTLSGVCRAEAPDAYRQYQPEAYVIPSTVNAVNSHVINLNGRWDFKFSDRSRWTSIEVPGEAAMQGYGVPHDRTVTYRRTFAIPASFKGNRIILRFDGTYSYATLYINGRKIRQHRGGFSRWETDVTDAVKPGRKNTIELKLIDPVEEISYASGYAHHPICGILRDVTIYALPEENIRNLRVTTEFDSIYRDADLRLAFDLSGDRSTSSSIRLLAPDGKEVASRRLTLTPGENRINIPVKSPEKWDAEHPNRYTLLIDLDHDGKQIASYSRRVGFREIRVEKDRLLVNGAPVKLRGACRHDIHPTLGRTTTREIDSLDVRLFKEANMNFVRTSHYPPTERFLDFCDEYGLYVECETGVCFVDTHRQRNYAPGATQNDSTFTAQYLGQLDEMVRSFQSHPSILLWSIGNESVYGSNFVKSHDLVRAYDPSRPVIFSYPGSVPQDSTQIYDILSMHYQDVNGNLWQWGKHTSGFQGEGIPALFDEWAHPACYTYSTLQTDPNIREFWGKSLDMMWNGVYNAPGALGGAIWGYIDERFMLPQPKQGTSYWKEFAHTAKPEGYRGDCVGYGDWGIVDIWRRKKPEFWATKKSYSPIRIESPRAISPAAGMPVNLTVFNRFDHTNLNEISARFTSGGATGTIEMPDVKPHQRGMITIPARRWSEGDSITVDFIALDGSLIDSYLLTVGTPAIDYPAGIAGGSTLRVDTSADLVTIAGSGFMIPFSKSTGLIDNATVGKETVIVSGPYLNLDINFNHLTGPEVRKVSSHLTTLPADWKMDRFDYAKDGSDIRVTTTGRYGDITVAYNILISPSGNIDISYTTGNLPNGYVRETGLMFTLPDSFTSLAWERDGYWDCYPDNSMSPGKGTVQLLNPAVVSYGQRPEQPWSLDTHDYYYWADAGADCDRPLTMAAKAMKENIHYYTLSSSGQPATLSVVSKSGDIACRLNKNSSGQLRLFTDNRWDYPEIAWGNYCKALPALPCYGEIHLTLGN